MNTAEKRAHFRSFGFVVQRQAFTLDEMQAITREFDDLMTELREGQPFTGESSENRAPFVELRPALSPAGGGRAHLRHRRGAARPRTASGLAPRATSPSATMPGTPIGRETKKRFRSYASRR